MSTLAVPASTLHYDQTDTNMAGNDVSRIPRRNKKDDDPKMIGLWKVGRTIGKGSSGRVRIARHSKTGQYAAVKIVSKNALLNSRISLHSLGDEAERILHSIEREIVIMKLIEHPNIMRLYDVWETSTELYLILEYVEGGELFDYLCNKGRLSSSEALGYFQQIITAINYCHRFNIAHRDLKPENLLLDREKNIKVADFGMAVWQGKGNMLQTACGSPHYAAPEVIMGRAYDGTSSDIWSCGVILFALLAGRLPFDDEDLPTLLERVKVGKYTMPSDIDPRARDLIMRMLQKDVAKRITIPDILRHPFYTSQKPKELDCDIPNLDDIARPLSSASDIDPDIFANLRTLWHGTPDADIIASLTNDKQTWEKGVYHLLVRYRAQHLENYDEEEEKVVAERVSKRRAKMSPETDAQEQLLASLPPRTGPPTPRRAARNLTVDSSPSPSAGFSRLRQISLLGSCLSSTAATTPSSSPMTTHAVSPSLLASPMPVTPVVHSPVSPHMVDVRQIPSLQVPEVHDEKVQQFLQQIVEHLNVIQAGGSTISSGYDQTRSPGTSVVPPSTPLAAGRQVAARGAQMNRHMGQGANNSSDVFGTPVSGQDNTTRPLSIRRRPSQRINYLESDKENVRYNPHLTVDDAHERKSSLRSNNTQTSDRRVQILEPSTGERMRLRKKRSALVPPASPASAVSEGSFVLPSTPKRRFASYARGLPPHT
ncbi:Serine/threonine-protein kinase HSL1 [Grifola frondosa]|uniref:non-specific serine/threonine protein kinase n=1 Tax=Grifola frondosa TaxID=5627 RepID=A0A1C7MAQ5_GRIFR|nr:Serine/threonine-protein kinase HSL1 [Grifola frondosa]